MSSKTTNLGLTKPAVDEFYDVDVQNKNMDEIDAEIGGLENPSYEEADKTAKLVSGEKYTIAFGKIAKAISTLIDHISAKATSSVLGHVKLSDSTSSTSAASAGVAATPKAVKAAYDLANKSSEKIGTTDISGIGDGTLTGAVDALNQSMPLLYHNGGKCDLKFGYSVGVIELTNSDATYSVSLPTPSTGYNYDSYKTTITCVASTNGLAYTFFNVSVSDNICKFKVKCLSGDRYDGGLYLGVHAMMTNA